MKRIACLAALVAVSAVPAFGQANDFQALLGGKDTPATIQLKDLNSDWKRIAISAPEGPMGNVGDMMKNIMPLAMMGGAGKGGSKDDMMGMAVMSSLFGGGGGPKGTVYYTKGLTSTIGGETFLIAYKVEAPQADFMKLIMESAAAGGKEPDFAKMAGDSKIKAESPLALTLVNVKSIGAMGSIRPFDLEKELAESSPGGGLMDLLMMAGQRHEAAVPPEAVKTAPARPAKPAKPANPATR